MKEFRIFLNNSTTCVLIYIDLLYSWYKIQCICTPDMNSDTRLYHTLCMSPVTTPFISPFWNTFALFFGLPRILFYFLCISHCQNLYHIPYELSTNISLRAFGPRANIGVSDVIQILPCIIFSIDVYHTHMYRGN